MANELWCVVECGADGEIYDPEFFKTKEKAIAFINHDSNECYGQCLDLPEVGIKIASDGLSAAVWTDVLRWTWRAFDVNDAVEEVL